MNSPEPAFFSSPAGQLTPPLVRKGGFHLVFHGLLVERHGIDLAVRAVNELRHSIPNLNLHLYGEPTSHLQSVLELSKTLGIEQFVHYYGFKTLPEIAQAISSMDLGLIPNRLNPFTALNMPTRIFEYLAVKKPVIVPRTGGIQDYFAEDEIIYFEPGNLEDLIRKILWVQTHPVEASEIVRKGYRVYEACRWDLQAQKLTDVISRLLPFPQSPRFVPSSQEHQTELATRRLARL